MSVPLADAEVAEPSSPLSPGDSCSAASRTARDVAPGGTGPANERSAKWAGVSVVAVSTAYMLLWWNRYLSPNSGGEIFYLSEFAAGRLPHRDFYYFVPPGTFLTSLAVGSVAGSHQIAFHLYGLCFRLLALWVLFRWLKQRVSPVVAAFAVIATGVIAAGDISDYPNFFQHQALGFSLFGAFAASLSVRASGWRQLAWAALAGLLLGVNLLHKQTTGVIVFCVVTSFLALGTWLFGDLRKAARAVLVEVLAFLVPVLSVVAWLADNGALAPFIDHVFLTGPSSKGGIAESLGRPFVGTFHNSSLLVCALLALVALSLATGTLVLKRTPGAFGLSPVLTVTLVVLLLLVAGAAGTRISLSSRTALLTCVYFGMLGGPPVALASVVLGRRERWEREKVFDLVFLATVASACAFSMSISFPAFEPMAYPGFAIIVAFYLGVRPPIRFGRAVQAGIATLVLLTVFVASWRKHVSPYDWGFWSEPPLAMSGVEPRTPGLEGFVLSESTARFFDEVTSKIQEFSEPEDRLLVFPHMPIFFALSHRRPAGFVFSYWFDICPDAAAVLDAKEILAHPPAVMVVQDVPPAVYWASETMFRGGRPSGQRKMAEAIAELAPHYRVVYQASSPGWRQSIRVLVRSDRLQGIGRAP